ncbi:hypothetical protein KQX54_008797 [Cotesia glomerata]|uniref:Ankyrin repeat protein n=1 Tax=Cotesia glomerata TaxID=32391 RepID=A0AAV7IYC5_COTGL|nr:hypothetical protein KQX54_008797 [Cotesia glomerata]
MKVTRKKIDKIFLSNIKELKLKHSRHLSCIINQNEMFQAIEQGDIKKLEDATIKGADISGIDYHGWSSLHYAAKGGNFAIFKYLIYRKVKYNFRNINGETLLHIAVRYGQIEIVEWLIRGLKNPEIEDYSKTTPLCLAIRCGYNDSIKLLLPYNYRYSYTVLLHCAVLSNRKDIVEFLVKNRNEHVDYYQNEEKQTLLYVAARSGYAELTQYLISLQSNVNRRSNLETTPLFEAACYGYVETVKLLLLNKADVNAYSISGTTVLHIAAENGHEEVVKVLLENGADVHKTDTALHLAEKKGSLNIVKLLVKYKADVNATTIYYDTPLHFAASGGHFKIEKFLLANKAVDTAPNETMNAPVHYAAKSGNTELMRLLLRHKGQILQRNLNDKNLLYLAAYHGYLEVVKLLVERGANCIDSTKSNGYNPLYVSVERNHLEIVKFFISIKVDINVRTVESSTPLSIAVFYGLYEIIKLLVEAGCFLNVKNTYGVTPLNLALLTNHQKIVEYLLTKHVDVMNDCNRTPLYLACQWNYSELVQLLINNGGEIIYYNMHCVDPALISGSKDVVEILLKAGVDVHDVNAVSGAKETTLMVAAYYNFTEIADFLLKNKANPGLKNENNYTDLDIAIMVNNYEAFYLLVESFKVEVTNQTSYKFRPLHVAAFHGRDKMVRFLTEKGFDINGRYLRVDKKPIYMAEDELTLFSLEVVDSLFTCVKEGDYIGCLDCLRRNAVVNAKSSSSLTPLHYTCQNGFSDIVKLLLDFNADINIAADFGTPLVYAVIYKHYDVVKILLKYGAVYNVTTKFGGNSLARLSTNSDIIHLLELIDKIFDAIKKCDPSIVDEIKKIKYLDILQCILSTRNNNNKELYLEAQNSKFPKDKFAEIYAHEAYLSAEKYTWNKIL